MKKTCIIATAVIGLALAAPLSAHHNCAAGDTCPEDIGDMMGNHEAAIDALGDMGGQMDPADDVSGVVPNQAGDAADSAGDQPNDAQSRPNDAQATPADQTRAWEGAPR